MVGYQNGVLPENIENDSGLLLAEIDADSNPENEKIRGAQK